MSLQSGSKQINIPIDTVIMPLQSNRGDFPLLIEAKSAGDYTNPNKRRKEEAIKFAQLRSNYGRNIRSILFLCGYFDSGYLGYEAADHVGDPLRERQLFLLTCYLPEGLFIPLDLFQLSCLFHHGKASTKRQYPYGYFLH